MDALTKEEIEEQFDILIHISTSPTTTVIYIYLKNIESNSN